MTCLRIAFFWVGSLLVTATGVASDDLPKTIAAVKPSVVGIGTMVPTRAPQVVFVATGFVTGDGLSVISNAHAVQATRGPDETLGIVTGRGSQLDFRPATIAAVDREHDLVHLRLAGSPLPALRLADAVPPEGSSLAFTGFPLSMMLGLIPATHRATLAAISPIALPATTSRSLDARALRQLKSSSFELFQLDGTAYPGNSGSPLYDPATGEVVGVINMTVLKGTREGAISTPSGISYAIPARHVAQLLRAGSGTK